MIHTAPLTGIDLLIARGPDIGDVVRAVETIAGIERFALKLPDDSDDKSVDILEHASWAAIDTYAGGDFAFKVALYGRTTRDYLATARTFAEQLRILVAWPDERTLAVTAFVACGPDGTEFNIVCDDAEPDGLTFRRLTLPLTRDDVNGVLANALWMQPHSATNKREFYSRALNNELDLDLRAVDDAILDAVRELGVLGADIIHTNVRIDLRRFYPPLLRTILRRALGRDVPVPDLSFDDIANPIWNAIPYECKVATEGSNKHE